MNKTGPSDEVGPKRRRHVLIQLGTRWIQASRVYFASTTMRVGATLFLLFLALWIFGVAGERTVRLGMRGAGAVLFLGQFNAWPRLLEWTRQAPPIQTSTREVAFTVGAVIGLAVCSLTVVSYIVGD